MRGTELQYFQPFEFSHSGNNWTENVSGTRTGSLLFLNDILTKSLTAAIELWAGKNIKWRLNAVLNEVLSGCIDCGYSCNELFSLENTF